jgi:hypothetical protein
MIDNYCAVYEMIALIIRIQSSTLEESNNNSASQPLIKNLSSRRRNDEYGY